MTLLCGDFAALSCRFENSPIFPPLYDHPRGLVETSWSQLLLSPVAGSWGASVFCFFLRTWWYDNEGYTFCCCVCVYRCVCLFGENGEETGGWAVWNVNSVLCSLWLPLCCYHNMSHHQCITTVKRQAVCSENGWELGSVQLILYFFATVHPCYYKHCISYCGPPAWFARKKMSWGNYIHSTVHLYLADTN